MGVNIRVCWEDHSLRCASKLAPKVGFLMVLGRFVFVFVLVFGMVHWKNNGLLKGF